MNKFIEMLKDKGLIDRLKITYALVGEPTVGTPEQKKETVGEAFMGCVTLEMMRDTKLQKAFAEYAAEVAHEHLSNELYKIVVEGK